MFTLAIQYPSFGPQHPPRLHAIVRAAPPDTRVVAMEMFRKDSDYEWRPVGAAPSAWLRYTVVDEESARARSRPFRLRRRIFAALAEINPDVLVVNGWGHRESRASLAWCRRNRRPVVLLSDSVRENRRRVWWKEAYKRWLLRGIPAGFAAGSPQARYLEHLGIPGEGVFQPGSCVVDNDFWSEATGDVRTRATELRARFDLPGRYFLCVARMLPLKNHERLLRAYARYRQRAGADAAGLVLCGSGPEEPRLQVLVETLRIPDVTFAGFRQVDELPVYYGLAECFVLPSREFECWGLVVNEAMASSLPVLLSTMVGSAEDLVEEGVNGFTFDPADEEGLTARMLTIASDAALRRSMGDASLRIIARHSLDAAADNLWRAVAVARGAAAP